MTSFRNGLLTAILSLATAISAAAQATADAPLTIRKIVLYKHGVGYFERRGTVTGRASIPLSFKTEQMKDVLKSLFAVDLGGGRISTILYDSKDPLSKQLEDILISVPDSSAFTQFLRQLRGARVAVTVSGAPRSEGVILGIEPVQTKTPEGVITTHKLILLRDDGALLPVDLAATLDVAILDEAVRRDLGRMMDIYARARYADRKVVTLAAEGDGAREIRAGYIIETPIWKTSYRLLFEENQPPLLQGWAIVENRTDEDWSDVDLSFVAGSPMSFILDLYTSYWPARPVMPVAVAAAEKKADGGSVDERAKASLRRARAGGATRMKDAAEAEDHDAPAPAAAPEPSLGLLLESSLEPAARGVEVGDLFAYQARGPVSIRRGQAALVPILLERLEKGERILHFAPAVSQHPQHGFLLDNTTALTLEKGPVTVFETSTLLGEGMLQKTLKAGMRAILAWSLETGVEIERTSGSEARPVTRATLADGLLTLTSSEVKSAVYRIRNRTAKAHVLLLDHDRSGPDWKLTAPEKAEDEYPGGHRFRIALAAGASAEFRVDEERPVSTSIAILSQSPEQIRWYVSQPFVSRATRDFLERVASTLDQIAAIDTKLRTLAEERQRHVADQARLRENMNVLKDSPKERTLRDQFVERLTASMERVDAIDREARENTEARARLHEALSREVAAMRE